MLEVVTKALLQADAHPEVAPSALLSLIVELTNALGTDYSRREVAKALVVAARNLHPDAVQPAAH